MTDSNLPRNVDAARPFLTTLLVAMVGVILHGFSVLSSSGISGVPAFGVATPALAAGFDVGDVKAGTPQEGLLEVLELIDSESWRRANLKLRKYVRSNPQDAEGWNLYGFVLRNSGRTEQAWEAYEKALAINPDHLGALEYIGALHAESGNLEEAEILYKKIVDICGTCMEADALRKELDNQ